MEILYKFLNADGACANGGTGKWYLPKGKRPGKWMPKIVGELVMCHNGYHLCRERDLVNWIAGTLWIAEYRGERQEDNDKVLVRQARLVHRVESWNERTARLFVADCAEHVLPIFERDNPDDKRPRTAIEIARRFANGEATKEELAAAWAAAGAAAWAASRAAAWDAAWAASRAAAWDAAWDAARDAAWAAARDAAWDAARDAAWDAEQEWQRQRLIEIIHG